MVARGSEASGGRGGSSLHTPAPVSTALYLQVPSIHLALTPFSITQVTTGEGGHSSKPKMARFSGGWAGGRPLRLHLPSSLLLSLLHWLLQGLGNGLAWLPGRRHHPSLPQTREEGWGGARPSAFPRKQHAAHWSPVPSHMAVLTPEIKGLRT